MDPGPFEELSDAKLAAITRLRQLDIEDVLKRKQRSTKGRTP